MTQARNTSPGQRWVMHHPRGKGRLTVTGREQHHQKTQQRLVTIGDQWDLFQSDPEKAGIHGDWRRHQA